MLHPFFFIHIPKTAGTSAREALVDYFGNKAVWADYGPQAPETHPTVKAHIHDAEDKFALLTHLRKQQCRVFTGHVTMRRYKDMFPVHKTFTFVREPLQRAISEYQHFLRHKDYTESFNTFISNKRNANTLTRHLMGVPLSAFGFIGMTDDYNQSISMLNHLYDWELRPLNLNQAPASQRNTLSITESESKLFLQLNEKDILLYEKIQYSYTQRKQLFKKSQPFTHGEYQIDQTGHLRGFAFRQHSEQPVEVDITVAGKTQRLVANERHPVIRQLRGPREGFVGFTLKLAASASQNTKEITVTAADTGQLLISAAD